MENVAPIGLTDASTAMKAVAKKVGPAKSTKADAAADAVAAAAAVSDLLFLRINTVRKDEPDLVLHQSLKHPLPV